MTDWLTYILLMLHWPVTIIPQWKPLLESLAWDCRPLGMRSWKVAGPQPDQGPLRSRRWYWVIFWPTGSMSLSTSNHSSLETTVKDVVPSLASSFWRRNRGYQVGRSSHHQTSESKFNSTENKIQLCQFHFLILISLFLILFLWYIHLVHWTSIYSSNFSFLNQSCLSEEGWNKPKYYKLVSHL